MDIIDSADKIQNLQGNRIQVKRIHGEISPEYIFADGPIFIADRTIRQGTKRAHLVYLPIRIDMDELEAPSNDARITKYFPDTIGQGIGYYVEILGPPSKQ